jgi:hypothetical protein
MITSFLRRFAAGWYQCTSMKSKTKWEAEKPPEQGQSALDDPVSKRLAEMEKKFEPSTEARDVEIVAVSITTAEAVYKASAKHPEQEVISVVFLVDGTQEVDNISVPSTSRGYVNEKSRLYQFRKKYGGLPERGLKVQVKQDDRMYWKVVT